MSGGLGRRPVNTALAVHDEDVSSDPTTQRTAVCGSATKAVSAGRTGEKGIPGAHWPAGLDESLSSRFSERPSKGRAESERRHLTLTSSLICTPTCTCASTSINM